MNRRTPYMPPPEIPMPKKQRPWSTADQTRFANELSPRPDLLAAQTAGPQAPPAGEESMTRQNFDREVLKNQGANQEIPDSYPRERSGYENPAADRATDRTRQAIVRTRVRTRAAEPSRMKTFVVGFVFGAILAFGICGLLS